MGCVSLLENIGKGGGVTSNTQPIKTITALSWVWQLLQSYLYYISQEYSMVSKDFYMTGVSQITHSIKLRMRQK
jgi:hypothetical protein